MAAAPLAFSTFFAATRCLEVGSLSPPTATSSPGATRTRSCMVTRHGSPAESSMKK